jgi:hypothetical protein
MASPRVWWTIPGSEVAWEWQADRAVVRTGLLTAEGGVLRFRAAEEWAPMWTSSRTRAGFQAFKDLTALFAEAMLAECVGQLDEPFRRSEIIGWFRRHYPHVNEATLGAYIQAATGNATNRAKNHPYLARRPPLLRRLDHGLYVRAANTVGDASAGRSRDSGVDQGGPAEESGATARQPSEGSMWTIRGERLVDDTVHIKLSIASVELPPGWLLT